MIEALVQKQGIVPLLLDRFAKASPPNFSLTLLRFANCLLRANSEIDIQNIANSPPEVQKICTMIFEKSTNMEEIMLACNIECSTSIYNQKHKRDRRTDSKLL